MTCKNVMRGVVADAMQDNIVGITCADCAMFDRHTNDSLYAVVDYIEDASARLSATDLKELTQCCGMNYNEHGMLCDRHLRTFYKPVDHCLRDWMHVLVNGGVANSHMYALVKTLQGVHLGLPILQPFIQKFNLPWRHGKVDATWLATKRMHKNGTLASFAGIMLSLIPIIGCFMIDVVAPVGVLGDHVRCFVLLCHIVGLLKLGPDEAIIHIDLLRRLLEEYVGLFAQLYPTRVKPKLHQLLHITDNLEFLGKLLSCFCAERKHRTTKKAALHIFRYIEGTVLKDMLNRQCDAVAGSSSSLFMQCYMPSSREVGFLGMRLLQSRSAVLQCGVVMQGDVVYLNSGACGRVLAFWKRDDHMFAQLDMYTQVNGVYMQWDTTRPKASFAYIDSIVDCVIWAVVRHGVIRVLPPFAEALRA